MTQHNDTQHYETQYNTNQHNGTQLNETQHNDTQHNYAQDIDTQHDITEDDHNLTKNKTNVGTLHSCNFMLSDASMQLCSVPLG
jgi:hypothetical protein